MDAKVDRIIAKLAKLNRKLGPGPLIFNQGGANLGEFTYVYTSSPDFQDFIASAKELADILEKENPGSLPG